MDNSELNAERGKFESWFLSVARDDGGIDEGSIYWGSAVVAFDAWVAAIKSRAEENGES